MNKEIFKLPEDNFIELYFINKFSDNEIRFWGTNNLSIAENIRQLKTHSEWMYCNIKGWIQFSISHGNSLPLLLYSKDKVYKSNRPKTDMSMFRQATSLKYDNIDDISLINDKYIRVLTL